MSNSIKKMFTNMRLTHLVLNGFKYKVANEYIAIEGDRQDKKNTRKIMAALPFDSETDKLFEDTLTSKLVNYDDRRYFPKQYAISSFRDGKHVFRPLQDCEETGIMSEQDMIGLLKKHGRLRFKKNRNYLKGSINRLSYKDGVYHLNGKETSVEAVFNVLRSIPKDTIFIEGNDKYSCGVGNFQCEAPVLHFIYLANKDGGHCLSDVFLSDHMRPDGTIGVFSDNIVSRDISPDDPRVKKAGLFGMNMALYFGDNEFFHMAVELTDDSFKVFEIDLGKTLACDIEFSPQVQALIDRKKDEDTTITFLEKVDIVKKYVYSWRAGRKGFIDYMYRNWKNGLKDDKKTDITTSAQKRWAHKRGFYSYRISQYGLTEENYRDFLSDYQYKRLRPINDDYQKWLWDKVQFYYVMRPFREYLPKYWCRVVPNVYGTGKPGIFSFKLLKDGECFGENEIISLLKSKGILVYKPAISSHGVGYYKLQYVSEDDKYLVNSQECTEEEMISLILGVEKTYLLSEYVTMHEDLRKIYDKVTFTMRVMTIREGTGSPVKNAFFRIASDSSGGTDNVAGGGIVARIDMETGRYHDAEILINHRFRPCPVHPDTGTKLEGQVPHWDLIREKIGDICQYLAPLEYLGFDVVITDDGFKILEINTHQDLHKYAEYPQDIKDYFRKKNEYKEKQLRH